MQQLVQHPLVNPFPAAEPWRVRGFDSVPSLSAAQVDQVVDEAQAGAAGLSDLDHRVYKAFAAYAFNEAICWPSQEQIAKNLCCARESVNRSVRRLREAGWLRVVERRWSRRTRWFHNVYELMAAYTVSDLAARRITRKAHRKQAGSGSGGQDHTKRRAIPRGRGRWCRCRHCKPDRTSIRQLPGPIRGLASEGRSKRRMRELFGDEFLPPAPAAAEYRTALGGRRPDLRRVVPGLTS